MTDPAGSDGLPGGITPEEAIERDAASTDHVPAGSDSDLADVERAGPADGL